MAQEKARVIALLLSLLLAPSFPSTSTSNEVYSTSPFNATSGLHYLSSSKGFVKMLLKDEDFLYDVKELPDQREVSIYLTKGEVKRLVFPLVVEGPLAIIITPCATPLIWTISLRYDQVPHADNGSQTFVSKEMDWISPRTAGAVTPTLHIINTTDPLGGNNTETVILTGAEGRSVDTSVKRHKTEDGSYKEIPVREYEGHEAVVFQETTAMVGLYVVQIQANGGPTHVHVQANSEGVLTPPIGRVQVSPVPATEGITLSWASRNTGDGYCLVLSEGRPYPSLCAARAAYLPLRHKTRDYAHTPILLLGCTDNPWYWLPSRPAHSLHVTVWAGATGGPPLSRGLVRGATRRRVPKLRKGKLLTLIPSAGGRAVVKYRVRKGGRKLHIMAVACGGRLKLQVESEGRHRLASAMGGQGALHLSLTPPVPATLFLVLITDPPGASHTLMLAAAPSVRRLPLPRLPRNSRVRVGAIGCTWVTFKWSAARASSSYCIIMEKESPGKTWRPRAPLQCGWEIALRNKNRYAASWCGPPTLTRPQTHTMNTLTPATNYTVTVLVRHSGTGRTLAFTPTFVTTSDSCPS